MKGIVHKYDQVIVGATFESLLYALFTNTPVLYVVPKEPTEFDTVPIGIDFKFLQTYSEITDIDTNQGKKLIRPQKNYIWGRLVFLLSLRGLLPATNLQSIRIEDNIIKLSTASSKLITVEANKILLFDDEGIEGLDKPIVENTRYIVKDYIEFNDMRFTDKEYDVIYTDYEFVNQIWFIPPSNLNRDKDGCLISYCESLKDLQDNLTDYNIKFILKEQFKKHKMIGRDNGIAPSGKQKYRPVRYTFVNRIVEKEKSNIYEDTEYIKFMNLSVYEITSMFVNKIPLKEYYICRKLSKISLQRRRSHTLRVSSQLQVKN